MRVVLLAAFLLVLMMVVSDRLARRGQLDRQLFRGRVGGMLTFPALAVIVSALVALVVAVIGAAGIWAWHVIGL